MQSAKASNQLAVTMRRLSENDAKALRLEWEAMHKGDGGHYRVMLLGDDRPAREIGDCIFCGSSGEPYKSGNCRGCGAQR